MAVGVGNQEAEEHDPGAGDYDSDGGPHISMLVAADDEAFGLAIALPRRYPVLGRASDLLRGGRKAWTGWR
jgi:hypothetical protein